MKDNIVFSIIMPTYNSERTLEMSLAGIRSQNFDQTQIEILVVDGGSTDKTIEIAKRYNSIIINNPDRLPEPAKLYGMQHARGKYICIMGSDEIYTDNTIFMKRYAFLLKHPEIHGMLADLIAPNGYPPCCFYLNAVGDPFTCFVYKTYGNRIYNLRKKLFYCEGDVNVYKFSDKDILPIGDGGGTVMDMDYIHEKYSNLVKTHETSVLWDIMIRDNGLVACMNGDFVEHLSLADFSTYLKKLKFRVVNNVHNVKGSGYAFRAQTNSKLNRRKYLYPIYCIILPWVIFDSLHMAFRLKHYIYLLHPFFCWYVLIQIIKEYCKKIFGIVSENKVYGR